MRLDQFLERWDLARATARLLLIVVGIEGVAIVALAYALVEQKRVITMIPPLFADEVSVSEDSADASYMQSWGNYLATLLGNVTPDTGKYIPNVIGPLLCAGEYKATLDAVQADLDRMRQDQIVLTFSPQKLVFEPASGKTFVTGSATQSTGSGGHEEFTRTFELKLTIAQYRVSLCGVTSYRGGPRTLDVVQADQGGSNG